MTRTPRWTSAIAGLAGLAWYLVVGGGPTINPLNSGWLSGDWMQHWLGFLYFKHDPWTFPLGKLISLPYPIGTSIGFTDSNPLVSIALKPFASVLPNEFQFIGLWLFMCFGLQGYFGARLCSVVTNNPVQQVLGGCLFALSPVLTTRIGHDALSAHWLILALLYFGLRRYDDRKLAVRSAWGAMGFVWLSATIHPYLTAMCFVLGIACLWRLVKTGNLSIGRGAVLAGVMAAGTVLLFWIVGYFGRGESAIGGFGDYSADLLALFDPRGTSRLLPAIPTQPAQWEGFAFPGLGGWLAILFAAAWTVRRPRIEWQHRKIIVWAAIALAVYSLSSHITFAGEVVARVRRFYSYFQPIPSLFRASGRFIWPLHYLLLLFAVWGIARMGTRIRSVVATTILAGCLCVQALDFRMNPYWFSDKALRQATAASFESTRGDYDHLALFPLQIAGGCGVVPTDELYVYRYALLGYRLGLTFNSGTFARAPTPNLEQECSQQYDQIRAGRLDVRTVYLVWPDYVVLFKDAGAICNRFDGDTVCVSAQSTGRFRTFLETGRVPQ